MRLCLHRGNGQSAGGLTQVPARADISDVPATLDLLEAKRAETYAGLLHEGGDGVAFETKTHWLEEQMQLLYRFALEQSKGDLSVQEVFELWGKMVSIRDFFTDHVRILARQSPCTVCYDKLLELSLTCDDKREFHRCCQ